MYGRKKDLKEPGLARHVASGECSSLVGPVTRAIENRDPTTARQCTCNPHRTKKKTFGDTTGFRVSEMIFQHTPPCADRIGLSRQAGGCGIIVHPPVIERLGN